MRLLNAENGYGLISIILHWLTACAVIALFIAGIWMVDLDYYSPWYKIAPDIHRSVGILLLFIISLRLALRLLASSPQPHGDLRPWERRAAHWMHWFLLGNVVLVIAAGYLMSTADGRAISVFGWFEVPSTVTSIDRQEDVFGDIHYYLAVMLISAAALHALAALKHQVIDGHRSLRRIIVPARSQQDL